MKIDELITRLVKFLENTDYMWDIYDYVIYVYWYDQRPQPYEEEKEIIFAFAEYGFHLDIGRFDHRIVLHQTKKQLPHLKEYLIAYCHDRARDVTKRLEKLNAPD